jgi:uncharacterized protein
MMTPGRRATAYAAGLVFGVGLVVSGMIDPRNILAFLDFGGAGGPWKPTLAAVMGGAIATHFLLLRLRARRGAGAGAPAAATPTVVVSAPGDRWARAGIDRRLIGGSAIFGVGWGLAGYCPGPAIVALGLGAGRAWVFVAAMIAGGLIADATSGRVRVARRAGAASAAGR